MIVTATYDNFCLTIEADFNCHTESFGPDDCEHEINLKSWSVEGHTMPNDILYSEAGSEMLRRLEEIAWEKYIEYEGDWEQGSYFAEDYA